MNARNPRSDPSDPSVARDRAREREHAGDHLRTEQERPPANRLIPRQRRPVGRIDGLEAEHLLSRRGTQRLPEVDEVEGAAQQGDDRDDHRDDDPDHEAAADGDPERDRPEDDRDQRDRDPEDDRVDDVGDDAHRRVGVDHARGRPRGDLRRREALGLWLRCRPVARGRGGRPGRRRRRRRRCGLRGRGRGRPSRGIRHRSPLPRRRERAASATGYGAGAPYGSPAGTTPVRRRVGARGASGRVVDSDPSARDREMAT